MDLRLDRKIGLLAAFVVALLVPFLWSSGVGRDADAWRLLLAGEIQAESGMYTMSRPPGYPVVELVSWGLAGAPTWVYLALTATMTLIAVLAFADLLRTLRVGAWIPLTLGFALTPVIFRNAVTFMDYNWSLAFLMVSWAALARSWWTTAGLMFGLALATRPATAVVAVVLVVVLWRQREPLIAWAKVLLFPVLVVNMFFAVPVALFGDGVLGAVPEDASIAVIAGRLSVGVWGSFGALAIALAVVATGYRLVQDHRAGRVGSPWVPAAVVGVVAQIGLYVVLPADSGYVSPAVPLVWLLLGVALGRIAILAVAAAVAASSFVAPGDSDLFGTTMLRDRAERQQNEAYLLDVAGRIEQLPPGTVVLAGFHMPQLLAMHGPEVAADSRTAEPTRPAIGNRFVLLGGQVLAGSLDPVDEEAASIYRLAEVDGEHPELPAG